MESPSSSIVFDAAAVESWVNLCTEATAAKSNGASEEEIKLINVRVILEMVSLLPNVTDEDKANIAISMIRNNNTLPIEVTVSEPAAEDTAAEDPVIINPPSASHQ
jgi:hypothetical protein